MSADRSTRTRAAKTSEKLDLATRVCFPLHDSYITQGGLALLQTKMYSLAEHVPNFQEPTEHDLRYATIQVDR